ncbi:MAG: GNAT family N-acetyltransferase [Motilibacteraceae bacterium]
MTAPRLLGPRVLLRSVRAEDEAERQRLGWHASIERNYGHVTEDREMTAHEARVWFQAVRQAEQDATRRHWVIEADGRLVGVTFLHGISAQDRKARFAIGLFHPADLGRGLGGEATRLVLRHAFTDLALNRVDLRVLAFNEAAIACYQRCGFIVEGRERESCWLDGRPYDDLVLGILGREFTESTTREDLS